MAPRMTSAQPAEAASDSDATSSDGSSDEDPPMEAQDEVVQMLVMRTRTEPYGEHPAEVLTRVHSEPISRPEADRRWRSWLGSGLALSEEDKRSCATQPRNRCQELRYTLTLCLGATGVVFGDIGTSPLYTFSGIFVEALHEESPKPEDIQGAFSMIFWLLTWVVCLKYIGMVLRVSHHGEGGTFAMMQTIAGSQDQRGRQLRASTKGAVLIAAMLGCSLIIGDGCITPVISVLGALEGLPGHLSETMHCAIAVFILIFIFMVQRRGSQVIGLCAGPVVLTWFLSIAGIGVYNLSAYPTAAATVLAGLNPAKMVHFWTRGTFRGVRAWQSLSGVVLSVTGAEALYADMGHFGATPIRLAWFSLVYPCLVLQYLGQATMLCVSPEGVASPFFHAVPGSLKLPMTVLATLAAVIASQAMITGLFTMLTQAYALKLVPRLRVLHTNPDEQGQVYIPEVNWMLCLVCIVLCVAFRSAAKLAGAYGIAVTCTFVVTTCLLSLVLRRVWQWRWWAVLLVIFPLLAVDLLLCTANLMKIVDSGWVPILIAFLSCLFMHTHHWGRHFEEHVMAVEAKDEVEIMDGGGNGNEDPGAPALLDLAKVSTVPGLLHFLRQPSLVRTQTAAIFMTPYVWRVPRTVGVLATTLGCLPQAIVLLNLSFEDMPFVAEQGRFSFQALGEGLFSVVLHFGYAEPLTAERFGVHAYLALLARQQVGQYPALAPLLEMDSHLDTSDRTMSRILTVSHMPELEASAGMRGREQVLSASANSDEIPSERKGATVVLHRLHYVAKPEHNVCVRLRIWLYSFIVLNARKAIDFFGLEKGNTMEIAVVRFL